MPSEGETRIDAPAPDADSTLSVARKPAGAEKWIALGGASWSVLPAGVWRKGAPNGAPLAWAVSCQNPGEQSGAPDGTVAGGIMVATAVDPLARSGTSCATCVALSKRKTDRRADLDRRFSLKNAGQ